MVWNNLRLYRHRVRPKAELPVGDPCERPTNPSEALYFGVPQKICAFKHTLKKKYPPLEGQYCRKAAGVLVPAVCGGCSVGIITTQSEY